LDNFGSFGKFCGLPTPKVLYLEVPVLIRILPQFWDTWDTPRERSFCAPRSDAWNILRGGATGIFTCCFCGVEKSFSVAIVSILCAMLVVMSR
jgi:hypothetical protein